MMVEGYLQTQNHIKLSTQMMCPPQEQPKNSLNGGIVRNYNQNQKWVADMIGQLEWN